MYHECIAEAYSYKGDEFHMNGSYINKVLKEEVELFEWPSYVYPVALTSLCIPSIFMLFNFKYRPK